MLNTIFVLAARGTITEQVLEQCTDSAKRVGLASRLTPWLNFVDAFFIRNTIDAEKAVRDQSLAWSWQTMASVRIAIDSATRPAELLTIHDYWTDVLPKAVSGLFVLADIEHLVTSAWQLC